MNPSAALTAAESFKKHDLEFRTVITLLNMLGSSGRISLNKFEVPLRHRHHLKLLVALSSLLVREHEIVAVIAKRNASGTTFVLGCNSNETDTNRLGIRDDESTVSSSASDPVICYGTWLSNSGSSDHWLNFNIVARVFRCLPMSRTH